MAKRKPESERRVQVPVRLTQSDLDRLDRLIYWSGRGRTKQGLIEQGIRELMERIETEEHRGKPFPEIPE